MKLLLVCIDGLRLDMALPEVLQHDPGFAQPDHPADPRFVRGVGEGLSFSLLRAAYCPCVNSESPVLGCTP